MQEIEKELKSLSKQVQLLKQIYKRGEVSTFKCFLTIIKSTADKMEEKLKDKV